jgi:hypothetical protein
MTEFLLMLPAGRPLVTDTAAVATETPDTSNIAEDECCICGGSVSAIDPFGYPFCAEDIDRAEFLSLGRQHHWPALDTPQHYSIDHSLQAWLLTALAGTQERVIALLDALDEYTAEKESNP